MKGLCSLNPPVRLSSMVGPQPRFQLFYEAFF